MKYTKEQLEKMSDFEINKLVGLSIGIMRKGKTKKYYERVMPNYCNNPSDMMPLVFGEALFHFLVSNTEGKAGGNISVWEKAMSDHNCSELRAAAIVYLLIKGECDES